MTTGRTWFLLSILLGSALVFARPFPIEACGPFFPKAYFTFSTRPDPPLDDFVRGKLGVLKPTYVPSWLVVAYRHLAGPGLSEEEKRSFLKEKVQEPEGPGRDPADSWLDLRKRVTGAIPLGNLAREKAYGKGDSRSWFLNCNEEAFLTARKTLQARIDRFGPASPEVREWLSGQDRVFENCSRGPAIPPPAPAGIDPVIRADRAYQIAAAHFYAQEFDEAERLFGEIGRDPSSPWKQIAPYLAIRALVRKASLTQGEGGNDPALLARAEAGLKEILANPGLTSVHPAAERLLALVRARLDPGKRLRELSEALMKGDGAAFGATLNDYLYLLNRVEAGDPGELTDWVRTFKEGDRTRAVSKWEETRRLPWLVASLSLITGDHPSKESLLKEAERVDRGSPAYPSVAYHRIRLLIASGRFDEARGGLEEVLSKGRVLLPPSSFNLFLALGLKTARTLDEFLGYGSRVPAVVDYDDRREPSAAFPDRSEELKRLDGLAFFDSDAAGLLSQAVPLRMMPKVIQSARVPENLRRELAVASWTKAVLIGDEKAAAEMMPLLAGLVPALKQDLDAFMKETTPEGRRSAAVFLILRNPGMKPYLRPGVPRLTPIGEIDEYRDNWWCDFKGKREISFFPCPARADDPPPFLGEEDRKTAEAEWMRLVAAGAAPNYLAAKAIEWSKAHPRDPRLPEALHLAVKATRYGQGDPETTRYSRAAFTLLHRRYPGGPWAKKTPYWF